MKLILLKDVDNLGEEGEIVTVKDGFGRNYLIPQRLAAMATDSAVRRIEEERRQQSRRIAKAKDDAATIAAQLNETEVVIEARVGEGNRIFGTVTTQQIAEKLESVGFDIDRRNIELSEDIRMVGVYTANIKLLKDITAQVKVRVVPEE